MEKSCMKIGDGETLLMIGDSITDADRGRPVGNRSFGGLGNGYVCYVDALLGAACPEKKIRVLNTGIGGNTVRDLKGRWREDVLDLKPDWLSIMIGINDVWRQFDSPQNKSSHVHPEEFERTLAELVESTVPHLKGLILMTPYYIESDASDPMRVMMDQYGSMVKNIAAKNGAVLVDTQAAFNLMMESLNPASIAADKVHPNCLGHIALARAFLKAVEFEW